MTTEVMKQEEQTRAMRARLPISTDGSQNMRQAINDTSQSHSCTWPSCNPEAEKQEPVAWRAVGGSIWGHKTCEDDRPLYTTPARPWVGLTKEEAADCWSNEAVRTWLAIEAALKEKNAT